ncbi:PapB/FocB family fimbrial expression transcriptional regulator [Escherichia coli]|uniref:PapB/FocB family fimbrial expression transcriptional regulator n=1 Tax=Escherichia coli TaxID=562 RepID=UPI0029C7CD62|nr:PapB/FocB family fimbrial expression transcriptional regulator [Escherichia coli]WOR72034.1 PapB/FocB family fimbrial expression transcriptional regulator [Escherichia coli]HCL7979515.1 transcriptional regulator [Escherichia coli]
MKICWRPAIKGERYNLPGSMTEEHFDKLISLTPINSRKVTLALKDYFVNGYTRKNACDKNNVSQGYFSISVRKLMRTNNMVASIVEFYILSRA